MTIGQPDDPGLIADLRAAKDAIENEPYRPDTIHLTGSAYRLARRMIAEFTADRDNRRNTDGYLFWHPVANTEPPTTTDPASEGWISLGHTTGGHAFNDHGEYNPSAPPDVADTTLELGTMWVGDPEPRPDPDALYGGPPAPPTEPAPE